MSKIPEFPAVDEALLRALEARYPPLCIEPDQTPEAAHRYAGKVELVQMLRGVQRQQDEGRR